MTAAQGSELSRDLEAGTDTGLRAAVVVPAEQKLDPAAAHAMAAMGPITFDTSSFRRADAMHATVTGEVTHPPAGGPVAWTFFLAYAGRQWKISDATAAR